MVEQAITDSQPIDISYFNENMLSASIQNYHHYADTDTIDTDTYIDNSVYLLSIYNKIEALKSIYIFKNPEEIERFLLNNQELISILESAPIQIFKIFENCPIFLEVHHDSEEGWDELFIVIKSNYSAEKAIELEEELFHTWFIEIIDKVGNKLNFTEEPL